MLRHINIMGTKSFIITFLVVFIFLSCKKENSDSVTNTPPSQCTVISGYTGSDVTGAWTGITDTTDWRLDDNWTLCEHDLFGDTTNISNCTFNDTLLTNPIAFPNPTHDLFSFSIGIHFIGIDSTLLQSINHNDSLIRVDLLILNQRLQPLSFVHTNKYQLNHLTVSLNHIDPTTSDTLFRVYYILTDINNCMRTGHGDIVRQ